jgi:molybdate transport system substrate-binding protein
VRASSLQLSVLTWLAVVACSSAPRDELVVFAAASLRQPFDELGELLRAEHPGLVLTFNFAGSQQLRAQIEQGAPADVFAAADHVHMARLREAGRVDEPSVFARSELVMVVQPQHAARVHGLSDLPALQRLVIGATEVPVGRYTRKLLDQAAPALGADFPDRVLAKVVSHELSVKQVLAKVALGEADAGIVYRSDVTAADGRVVARAIAAEYNVIAEYPIAGVRGAKHSARAAEFVRLVQGPRGQAALARAGYLPLAQASAGHR